MKEKLYSIVLIACYLFSFAPVSAAQEANSQQRRHHGGHHRKPDGRHHQKGHTQKDHHRGHHRRPHHEGHHGRKYGHHERGKHHRFIPRDPAKRRLFCERHPRPCQRRGIVIPGVIAAATPQPGQEGLVNPPATEVIVDTALTEHTAITAEEQGYEEAEEESSPVKSLAQSYFEDEEEEDDDDDENDDE